MDSVRWSNIKSCQTNCDPKQFWKAIQIWVEKPHVVNRRLAAAVSVGTVFRTSSTVNSAFKELLKNNDTFKDCNKVQEFVNTQLCLDEVNAKEQTNSKVENELEDLSLLKVSVRKLIPKGIINPNEGTRTNETADRDSTIEIVLLDYTLQSATFVPFHSLEFARCSYRFSLDESLTSLTLSLPADYLEPASSSAAVTRPTSAWLSDTLLLKLAKWACDVDPDTPLSTSHALISVERYSSLYVELKQKYGPKFVKIWPENTDPQKFVYEDVAIATYILLLWEQEREEEKSERKQSFVDLGCGNGFLVHILNSEGHPGKGIDLRSRGIWSLYGPGTNLEECSIIPSDRYLFPDTDWLIGNHSDELTPWIPVMASRSSLHTNYFVLPCCFHDFAGKFVRSNSNQTQYRSYLDFIREVGEVCGYEVQEDTMRIPSTKRICQVGKRRTKPSPEEHSILDETIQSFISSRCPSKLLNKPITNFSHNSLSSKMMSSKSSAGDPADDVQMGKESGCTSESNVPRTQTDESTSISSQSQSDICQEQWAKDFQPRSKVEAVRNCSRLSVDFKERIVNDIALALLRLGGVQTNVEVDEERSAENKVKGQKLWRRGGKMTMQEVVALFDGSMMKQLKNECGGLKTMLKNANQVFEVSGDLVQLRDWSAMSGGTESATKKRKGHKGRTDSKPIKTRQCWFYMHHPDGCPRLTSDCSFAHGVDDVQVPPPMPNKNR
ncbi:probable tRNA (uracil-O(2)-)-methyltransferase [Amphiura filiformis]|uniref:probable tRNA (uracil-O(2)-)-methyltransferase n=1 Tax=Amphiura filiformis TaxID=82378 RepID=UPI003B22896F